MYVLFLTILGYLRVKPKHMPYLKRKRYFDDNFTISWDISSITLWQLINLLSSFISLFLFNANGLFLCVSVLENITLIGSLRSLEVSTALTYLNFIVLGTWKRVYNVGYFNFPWKWWCNFRQFKSFRHKNFNFFR